MRIMWYSISKIIVSTSFHHFKDNFHGNIQSQFTHTLVGNTCQL